MTFLWSLNGGHNFKFLPTFGRIRNSEFYIQQNVVQNVTFYIPIINPILVQLEHRNSPCVILAVTFRTLKDLAIAHQFYNRPLRDHAIACVLELYIVTPQAAIRTNKSSSWYRVCMHKFLVHTVTIDCFDVNLRQNPS